MAAGGSFLAHTTPSDLWGRTITKAEPGEEGSKAPLPTCPAAQDPAPWLCNKQTAVRNSLGGLLQQLHDK